MKFDKELIFNTSSIINHNSSFVYPKNLLFTKKSAPISVKASSKGYKINNFVIF